MKKIIDKISDEFIQEAKSSPRMLEDLAAMEKYMAESYDGRTFVELIQNADDANAKRMYVFNSGKDLIVANDGRTFDENDVLAICRSGSSQKLRGENIGYRGVGFKSATVISNEIIIYSNDAYFTFSKKLCADRLGLPEDAVPVVRIPFPYDDSNIESQLMIKLHEQREAGFTTFFIFKNARLQKFEEEIENFGADWLLFLRCLESIFVDLPSKKQMSQVKRLNVNSLESCVEVLDYNKESWYLVADGSVTLAFKYDNGSIIPCESKEGIFHCFLPTLDLTGFPFKINADFSTDPSRKHIIKDDVTTPLLRNAEDLYVKFVSDIVKNRRDDMMAAISFLYRFSSLNDYVIEFKQNIYKKLSDLAWVLSFNNHISKPGDLRLLPDWLDDDEKSELQNLTEIANQTPSSYFINHVQYGEKILSLLGTRYYTNIEMFRIISAYDNCCFLGNATIAKIFASGLRGKDYNSDIISDIYIPLESGYKQLKATVENDAMVSTFSTIVFDMLSAQELKNLAFIFPLFKTLADEKIKKNSRKVKSLAPLNDKAKLAINKWKSPVQNCIASETLLGYSAKDVSRNETAYSVISESATGGKRYIAVKQIPIMGDSFLLSEKEFEAAQRLGSEYLIFVVTSETSDVEYGYLENPYESLKLERKVKEWEWFCNDYEIITNDLPSKENLLDEQVLQNLSKDFFNMEQRNFLNQLLETDSLEKIDRAGVIGEQINSIADFYIGRPILDINDKKISIKNSLSATLKQIME